MPEQIVKNGRPIDLHTTQRFSRRGVAFLWNKREELDAGQVAIVDTIYKNRKKGQVEGSQSITYKLSHSAAGKLGYGRYYGQKGSLETLERECRGTICRDYYHDIDMVNAHPVLLIQLAHQYRKDLPEMEAYVDRREEVLARVSENREEAKTAVIKVLYGGRPPHTVLDPMYREVREFTKFLSHRDEFAELKEALKSAENFYGTFLSYILQTLERDAMLAMKKSFEKDGWTVDVLAYDGVMIRKNAALDVGKSMERAQAAIQTATGYRVTLLEKPMEAFDIPADQEEVVKGVTRGDYNAMKREFEMEHFYFAPTNQYAECRGGKLTFYDIGHAKEYFSPTWRFKLSDRFDDFMEFFPIYRQDETRRIVTMVDLQPHPGDLSIFTPPLEFAYTKVTDTCFENRDEVLELFQTLIQLNSGNNPVLADYLTNYCAHSLQQPFDLPGVAIVITGAKGVGKDTLGDVLIQYVFGTEYATNYQSNQQFFDKHDCGRENKFMVKLEEADRSFCVKDASFVKSMITAPMSSFNPKGTKAYHTPNYIRHWFTTNKANPVDMTDGERRFVILGCSADKKGDFAFWSRVRQKLFTERAGAIIADWLMKRDLTGFNVRELPVNEYQQAVVDDEQTSEDRFISQWDGAELHINDLYNLYRNWCVDNQQIYAPSTISLGRKMLKYVRDGEIRKRVGAGNRPHYRKNGQPQLG